MAGLFTAIWTTTLLLRQYPHSYYEFCYNNDCYATVAITTTKRFNLHQINAPLLLVLHTEDSGIAKKLAVVICRDFNGKIGEEHQSAKMQSVQRKKMASG